MGRKNGIISNRMPLSNVMTENTEFKVDWCRKIYDADVATWSIKLVENVRHMYKRVLYVNVMSPKMTSQVININPSLWNYRTHEFNGYNAGDTQSVNSERVFTTKWIEVRES
jgi:hypothetical protein